MNYMDEYFFKIIRKKYAKFRGRATRAEFWFFTLFITLLNLLVFGTGNFLKEYYFLQNEAQNFISALQILVWLITLLPFIAVGIRRLHDIGKSSWWYLLMFIPLLGHLILIGFFIMPSENRTNRHGSSPNRYPVGSIFEKIQQV